MTRCTCLKFQIMPPNTAAINCQASLDLHNNSNIKDFFALSNKNRSDKISVGYRELEIVYSFFIL
jgi:hypothetical protein